MSRKEKWLTMDEPKSRDHGKTYLLKEADALTAEWWATRALLALTNSGVDVGNATGMMALAIAGFEAMSKLRPEEVKPLFDEMLEWIYICPDSKARDNVRPINVKIGDVEEVATLMQLRIALFELHTGFSLPALPSISPPAEAGQNSSSTPTSPRQ